MIASTTRKHITLAEIAAVADAADPATHAHLDDGWTPPPVGKLDHFALMPEPATREPSEDARQDATRAATETLPRPARRELAAVMDLGREGLNAGTFKALAEAKREGRVGSDEVDYLAGKEPLAEYLCKGLAALGLA